MSIKFHYSYRSFPYSKRATEYSHLATIFIVFAVIMAFCSGIELVSGSVDIEYLAGFIASIAYILLYATVIRRKINKIAREDYIAELTKQIDIEREKIKNLPRE